MGEKSVNKRAFDYVKILCSDPEYYGVKVKTILDTTIIDLGIEARSGYLAGKILTEICLGGFGVVSINCKLFGEIELPSISVYTDEPVIATLASQLAGWQINFAGYKAIGSGPARALSLKPKKLYEKIGYEDDSDIGVIILETSEEPNLEVIEYISKECRIKTKNLYILLSPTGSLSGCLQISGRALETGIHKMVELGFEPRFFSNGFGCAPIAPSNRNQKKAMGLTNDMILYGSSIFLTVNCEDINITKILTNIPSSSSKSYGKPFNEIFKEAGYDFYKIDSGLFAPAYIIINNISTGHTFVTGQINSEVLKKSISIN